MHNELQRINYPNKEIKNLFKTKCKAIGMTMSARLGYLIRKDLSTPTIDGYQEEQ